MNKYEEALESYTTAIKINPNFPEAHCNLGATLNELGQHEQAS